VRSTLPPFDFQSLKLKGTNLIYRNILDENEMLKIQNSQNMSATEAKHEDDSQNKFHELNDALIEGREAMKRITLKSLIEIKALKNPPQALFSLIQALVVILGEKNDLPEKVKHKYLGNCNELIQMLIALNPEKLDESIIQKVKTILGEEMINNPLIMHNISKPGYEILLWIISVIKYNELYRSMQSNNQNIPFSFNQALNQNEKNSGKLQYCGYWDQKTNLKEGIGIQVFADGSIYEGQWKNSKPHGKGRLIHIDGDVYFGDWKEEKADGTGVYTHIDGSRYEGEWSRDLQEGKGKEFWPDGSNYQGEYHLGKKNGNGILHWTEGSEYKGEFKENNIEGKGEYLWSDGRRYIGEWISNKMQGKGTFIWPDGKIYEGCFVNDKKEGIGKMRWPNGKIYEGGWLNGKQHGKGVFTNDKGEKTEGNWINGKKEQFESSNPPQLNE